MVKPADVTALMHCDKEPKGTAIRIVMQVWRVGRSD